MAMIYFPVVSFPLEAEEQPAFVVNPTVGTGSVAAPVPAPIPSCRHHVIYPSQARPQLSETSNKSTVKREE